jgi:hypothetical protein
LDGSGEGRLTALLAGQAVAVGVRQRDDPAAAAGDPHALHDTGVASAPYAEVAINDVADRKQDPRAHLLNHPAKVGGGARAVLNQLRWWHTLRSAEEQLGHGSVVLEAGTTAESGLDDIEMQFVVAL